MSIMSVVKRTLPHAPEAFFDRVKGLRAPRYMIAGDIGHWVNLRGQINAATGKINSYRDIRRICGVEGKTVPSLGTLRNYLGEGGEFRQDQSRFEWQEWFERFGNLTVNFKEELSDVTTTEEWKAFQTEYEVFMGY